jgi:peptide/nickel transport system permease protein
LRIAKRIGAAIIMIFAVTTVIFFLIRLMPGSPYVTEINTLLRQGYSLTQAENDAKALYGFQLRAPILVQYQQYMVNLVHGNLGTSLMFPGQSVLSLIAQAVPWTVLVVSSALLISFGIGVLLGALAAYRRGSWFDHLVTFGSSLLNGVPQYLTAILLFYFLAVLGRAFPMGGAYAPGVTPGFNVPFIVSMITHAILPVAAFVLSSFAGWSLSMKANTVSVLGEDYITASQAMAVRRRTIVVSYVGRNAILPLFTSLVLSVGFMFGGSLFVEQVFNYPGLGNLFLESTTSRDFPLMQGCFLLLTTAVILANVVADLLYSTLDPRIQQ